MDFEILWTLPAIPVHGLNRRGTGTSWVGIIDGSAIPGERLAGRVYVKRQQAFTCRPAWNGYRRTPTLRRELRFLVACKRVDIRVPNVIGYAEGTDERAVLLLEEVVESIDLEGRLAACSVSERSAVLTTVGAAVVALHRARIRHGALYAKHVLVGAAPEHYVTLIDLEKAHRSGSRSLAAASDLERLFRRTNCLTEAEQRSLRAMYPRAEFPLLDTLMRSQVNR